MKRWLKKITAILSLMMLIINSSLLIIISHAVDEIQDNIYESKVNILNEIQLKKYINCNTEEFVGVLTQFDIATGIEYEKEQEYCPIGSTGILFNLPKIESEYPEKVEVIGESTKATNGSDIAKDFDFVYDSETGELKIAVINMKDEEGNLYDKNIENARDKYTIICCYSSNCYDNSNKERNLDVSGYVQVNIANERDTREKSDFNESYKVKDNISGLISTDITTSDIYNGYIDSNNQNGTNYRTEYTEDLEIDISIEKISDEMNISTKHSFIDVKNNEFDTDEIIYKSTEINKNDVLNILGEDGYLQILDKQGNVLKTINKDIEVNEKGTYTIEYENDVNEIIIKTSKPIKVGKINLRNVKEIKETIDNVEICEIKTTHDIVCINNIEVQDDTDSDNIQVEKKKIYNYNSRNITEVKDSEIKVDFSIDKTQWTNNVQNEVKMNLKLIANSIECKLFKDSLIEIKLPSEVDKIILNDVSLLYADSLSVQNIEVLEVNSEKVIRIQLSGNQNQYYNSTMVQGTEILISATVIVKKDIYSTNTKIQLNCLNQGEEKSLQREVYIESINTPTSDQGVQFTNISNDYDTEQQDITSGIETQITATLGENILENNEVIFEHEYIRYNINLKNNSSSKVENINVVGIVPDGMTYVKTYFGEYSPQEKDLYRTEEDSTVTEYNEIVSLEPGEEKSLQYWVRVNLLDKELIEKKIQSNVFIIANDVTVDEYNNTFVVKKAEMELKINARETYRQDNMWIYDIYVKNNTNTDISNVIVNMDLQDGMIYSAYEKENTTNGEQSDTEEEEIDDGIDIEGYTVNETINGLKVDIPTLKSGRITKVELFIQILRTDEEKIDFEIQSFVSAKGDNTNTYYSNLNKEIIHTAGIEIIQTSDKEGEELQHDDEIEFNFIIKNISNKDIFKNLLSLETMYYADKNLIPLTAEYEEYKYNEETKKWEKGEVKVKDISKKYVPEGVDENSLADLSLVLAIPKEGEINLKLKCKAGEVQERAEISNCIKVVYDYCGTHTETSNIIKNVILPIEKDEENPPSEGETPGGQEPGDDEKPGEDPKPGDDEKPGDDQKPDDGDNEEIDLKYKISGFAWEDKNKNGKYDSSEPKLSDIVVKLFDSDSNTIVRDLKGNNLVVQTDDNGEYIFNNISSGKYLVLFEYDNKNYSVTAYKKDLVSEDVNSDVISKTAHIDGVQKIVAVTDIIELDSNKAYVNIGLIKSGKYDMSLNKSISKVIVKYDGFNKTYEYDRIKLAKVEIPSKNMNDASIELEYQIEIKNEGDIDGYVDEIIDYLPDGFSFDDKLNKGWSISANGILKNVSLTGILIKSGETKSISLYLTRKLTSDSIGILKNAAEILKSTSIDGMVDIDSVEGNRIQEEDDYSEAELIISVKTGALTYTGIIILAVVILIILKLLIDKKIINSSTLKIFSIITVLVLSIVFSDFSYAGDVEDAVYDELTASEALELVKKNYKPSSTSSVACQDRVVAKLPVGETYNGYYSYKTFKSNGVEVPNMVDVYETVHVLEGGSTISTSYQPSCSNPEHIDHDHNFLYEKQDGTKMVDGYWYCETLGYTSYYGNNAHIEGVLYCTDGASMGSKSPWYYSYSSLSSLSITSFESEGIKDAATIVDGGSSPEFIGCPDSDGDSDYYLVGPYSIVYEGDLITSTPYPTCNSSGSEIEISSGSSFYLKVPKTVNSIGDFTMKVERMGTITYQISYSYTERWTTGNHGSYTPQVLGKDGRNSITLDWETMTQNELTLPGANLPTGTLIIEKKDYDTESVISGATVLVENTEYYFKKEYSIGQTSISNLPAGTLYTVKELKAPDEYLLSLQYSSDINKEATVSEGSSVTVTLINRKYGNLIVNKVDYDTGRNNLESSVFQGVGFRIYYRGAKESGYISYSQGSPSTISTSGGQIFYTDSNAQFTLVNIPQYGTYTIEEVSLPTWMQQYYDVNASSSVSLISNWKGQSTYCTVTNKQLRVDIEGSVWEDIPTSKASAKDNLYNGSPDKLIQGITVYLKKNGNIIAQTKTDSNGRYFFAAKGSGYSIVINELSQYVVEFEYNGLKYENVATNLSRSNGSKASEKLQNRANLNNNFYNVLGKNDKKNGNKGQTGTGVDLTYSVGNNYNSQLVQNTSYTVDTLSGDVNPINSALMLADTGTAGYRITWSAGVRVIRNVNFGIYERSQPDLAIATDVEDVELNIRESYGHNYSYKERAKYMNEGIPDKELNSGYNANLDGFSVRIKNSDANYKNKTYTRYIYDSYLAYTKNDSTNEDRLRIFITYKIVVKNESANLISRVSLKNYADKRLTYSQSYYINKSGEKVSLDWVTSGNGIHFTQEIDNYIDAGKCMDVYLTYEMATEAIISLTTLRYSDNLVIDKNVTEINSYSTWDNSGNKHAGIDKDSAPNNIIYNDVSTYEDDTDAAPDLKFARKQSKVISGLVFEEDTSNKLETGQERIGNGKYERTENKVKNMDVQIKDYKNNEVIKLYNLDESGNVIVTNAQYLTGEDGVYSFTGMIPGTYYIEYTYGYYNRYDSNNGTSSWTQTKIGDINVTTESYKSTIVNAGKFKTLIDNNIENSSGYNAMLKDYIDHYDDALWYWHEDVSTYEYSTAVDDSRIRRMINDNLRTVNYDVKTKYDNLEDHQKFHYMKAYTGFIDFPIEDFKEQITDTTYSEGSREYQIKFGIIERPRQSIEIDKTISNVHITLSGGQSLVSGDPRTTTIPYVTYPGFQNLKIEVSNEIIEGSVLDTTYEIKVVNKSEIDYDNIEYYRYGNSSGLTPVKIRISSIADYVDEKLSVTYDIEETESQFRYYDSSDQIFNKWQLISDPLDELNKLAGIPINSGVYSQVKQRKNITVMDTDKMFKPNETIILNLSAQKLLTDLVNDDQVFDNHIEIIEVENSVGRFYGEMKNSRTWKSNTPGNYNMNNVSNTNELDNNRYVRSRIIILEPTGIQKIVIYSVIGVICLTILAGGILLIKKKVI